MSKIDRKILLVEDDIDLMNVTRMQLEAEGYQVFGAKDGACTKEILEKEKVDLILLDVMLPDCTGHELCEWIRERFAYPIIFMSCLGDSGTIVEAFRGGGDDYLIKPVDINELNRRIETNMAPRQIPGVRRFVRFIVDTNIREVYLKDSNDMPGEKVDLSPTEYKLLLAFIDHPKEIMLYRELYREIWEQGEIEDTRTLMVHVSNLRKKMNWQDKEVFKAVRGVGYIFNDV